MKLPIFTRTPRGVSLVELMIATALISVGILASVKGYQAIHEAIQFAKGKTLATTIGQEKIQTIMQKSYYEILVTTAAASKTIAGTTTLYDPSYFPPETILEGGMYFTRYTYIQVVTENSGAISILPPTTPDTGMRQITVVIAWTTNKGEKAVTVRSIANNPSTVMSRSILRGTVTNSVTGGALQNVLVNAAENVGWEDTSSATGAYQINLSPGTFNFLASAPGYYSATASLTLAANAATTQNFALTPISSGTVKGTVWINNHLVISQVVASTGSANSIEYIELYNPTTAPFNLGTNAAPSTPNIWTVAFDNSGSALGLRMVYISTFVPANGYYLITNTGDGSGTGTTCASIGINGTTVSPNACWRDIGMPNHALQCGTIGASGCAWAQNASGFGIAFNNSGGIWAGLGGVTKIDALAWNGTGVTPSSYETTALSPSGATGMTADEDFVRRLDTTTTISNTYGNAYDSENNSVDFILRSTPPFAPRNSSTIIRPIAGSLGTGSVVSITDGVSATTTTLLSTTSPPYASFTVNGVSSGTWSVLIDSRASSLEITSVTVVGSLSTTWIPNATTSPNWPATGSYASMLSTSGVVGLICGSVRDAAGALVSGSLTMTAGSASTTIGPTGNYCIRTSTGLYDVIANLGNQNSQYASQTEPNITVSLGDVTADIDFLLPKGGKLRGWMTRDGTNPLPGMTVVAKDANLIVRDSQVTAANGYFVLVNLTTGAYTVEPVLDMKETSNPTNAAVTVVAGATTWASTFTVTGAMGTVTGSVTLSGAVIKSGVLILISTGTVSLPPPSLSSNTLNSAAIYSDSAGEDGMYSIDVRGSTTTYRAYGYYMYLNGSTPVISTRSVTGITVNSGMTTTGVNFAW